MITILTQAGVDLLTEVIANEGVLEFVRAEFGSGLWAINDEEALNREIKETTELRNIVDELTMQYDADSHDVVDGHIEIDAENKLVKLKTVFDNSQIDTAFRLTEIGYWAQDLREETPTPVLFALSVTDRSTADYIPAKNEQVASFDYDCYIYVGDATQVAAAINVANNTASRTEFLDHINNHENPHETTKRHVGLGNVPNVPTNAQAPTFTMAESLENIDGSVAINDPLQLPGEAPRGKDTLSVIFGKVQRAIKVLIDHVNNVSNANFAKKKGNPHGTTADDVGAASIRHEHSAKEITNGVLAIKRGGTGHDKKAEFDNTTARNNSADCVVQYGTSYLQGDDKSVVMEQWGWLNCDSNQITVTFNHPYPDERYSLIFPTCGRRIIPIWRLESQTKNGFTLSRYFGIDSEPLKKVLHWIIDSQIFMSRDEKNAQKDWVNSHIGASQAADWIAIGKAGK